MYRPRRSWFRGIVDRELSGPGSRSTSSRARREREDEHALERVERSRAPRAGSRRSSSARPSSSRSGSCSKKTSDGLPVAVDEPDASKRICLLRLLRDRRRGASDRRGRRSPAARATASRTGRRRRFASGRAELAHAPRSSQRHAVRERRDRGHVVADEEDRAALAARPRPSSRGTCAGTPRRRRRAPRRRSGSPARDARRPRTRAGGTCRSSSA